MSSAFLESNVRAAQDGYEELAKELGEVTRKLQQQNLVADDRRRLESERDSKRSKARQALDLWRSLSAAAQRLESAMRA